MHGPSATPLLVELAVTALVLVAALSRKPLARLVRRRKPAPAPRALRLRRTHSQH
jgi:hypothetical protein